MTLNLTRHRNILFASLLLLLSLYGCSNALPRTEDTTRSRWDSFAEAMADYEKITPYTTTVEELKSLGYDPYTQPNIRILSYLDIIQRFMPNQSITLDDLDPGLSFCIQSRNLCQAYEARPQQAKTKRVGNVFMDLLTFKRRTIASGWSFNALIVLSDGIVVYKVWSGSPIISGDKLRKNPLGPLQGVNSSTLIDAL
ncbi:MAG: hypothetical protein KBT88_01730 [Gammaproteobacteria bacterium]|nr:hypothetical protein [Gammaproteobacteria bacterium]MBQ0838477.1 hypothetical protein [Gammaproteobacteria bacterium]